MRKSSIALSILVGVGVGFGLLTLAASAKENRVLCDRYLEAGRKIISTPIGMPGLPSRQWQMIESFNSQHGFLPGTNNRFFKSHRFAIHDAIDNFSKATEAAPNYWVGYAARGHALMSIGYYKTAINDFNKVLQLDPSNLDILWLAAVCYSHTGDHQSAADGYTRYIQSDAAKDKPYSMWAAYRNRGNEYAELGKYTEALADYNVAIRIEPRNGDGYYCRYKVYKRMGRGELASADKAKFLKYKDRTNLSYQNMDLDNADYIESTEPVPKVLEFYGKMLKADPYSEDVYYKRAQFYRKERRLTEALADANRAIELDPHFEQAIDFRCELQEEMGNRPAAALDQKRMIEIHFNRSALEENHLPEKTR